MSQAMTILLIAAGVVSCSTHDTSGLVESGRRGNDSIPVDSTTPPDSTPPPGGTGSIGGGVFSQDSSRFINIPDADVWLYTGDPARPETWSLVTFARTWSVESDFPGYLRIDSLPVGTYFMRADKPDNPFLAPGLSRHFQVEANGVVSPGVFLANVDARGKPYVRLWPRHERITSVCNGLWLRVAAGDEHGEPIADPVVTWSSSNTAVATIGDTVEVGNWSKVRVIHAVGAGDAFITATSGGLSDSIPMHVFPNSITCPTNAPVATVDVSPDSARITVGDTLGVGASPRDAAGNLILDRAVTWSTSDGSIVATEGSGTRITVRGRKAGTAVVRATIEGRSDEARITVH